MTFPAIKDVINYLGPSNFPQDILPSRFFKEALHVIGPSILLLLNGICEELQSGVKSRHSTESTLLRVFNYLLLTFDSAFSVVLVQLNITFFYRDFNTLLVLKAPY